MKIIELFGIKLGYPPFVFACRDQKEANQIAMVIQQEGGIPMQHDIEVPDDFNEFALDLPGKLEEPSLN
jgi:hypothetical protein